MNKNQEIAQRMRGIREDCEYTQEQVAARLGLSLAEYEKLESGEQELHVSVMHDFCNMMGIDLTELLTGSAPKLSHISIVRKGQGVGTERNKAYGYQNLAYSFMNRKIDPFLVTVEPNDSDEIPVSVHSGHEYHYCLEGRFMLVIDNHEYVIEEGDSVYFVSSSPHGMKALDNKPAKMLVAIV